MIYIYITKQETEVINGHAAKKDGKQIILDCNARSEAGLIKFIRKQAPDICDRLDLLIGPEFAKIEVKSAEFETYYTGTIRRDVFSGRIEFELKERIV